MSWDWSVFQSIIPISAIISAIVLPIVPLIFVPVLDYSVTQPHQVGQSRNFKSDIIITNIGIFTANNVSVSISANNISIINISTEPYLPNKTHSFTSEQLNYPGRGFFLAERLLSHATMVLHITMHVPPELQNEKLIVYVQSEESIGFHGVKFVIFAYVTVALILAFIALSFRRKKLDKKSEPLLYIPTFLCAVLVSVFLLLAYS